MVCSTDYELPHVCFQYYGVSWCNSSSVHTYCSSWQYENVTGGLTQFKLDVLAGYKYHFYVYAVTAYGQGSWANIQSTVPPLNLQVRSAYASKTGRYGLQVYLHWYGPYSSSEHYVSKDTSSSSLIYKHS